MRVAVLLIGALLMPAFAIPTLAHAQSPTDTRVMNAFMRHGLTRDKAWCYSQVIGRMLGPDGAVRAAAIVEAAPSGQAVQQGVMSAGMPMMNAFSTAHNTCGQ
ncbi:MAG: hypothetical protein AB7H90_04540 [Alphaproteobacteria bacterium]